MRIASKAAWAGVGATLCLLCATVTFASGKRQRDLSLPVTIRFTPPSTCEVSFSGQAFSLPDDEDRMVAALRELRRDWQSVAILGDGEAPYRCIGHAIFVAQRGGFARVDYKAQAQEE
jgi:hypothetical protein